MPHSAPPPKEKLSRRLLLDTALQLIAAEGIESLTMRLLARKAGCTVGALPHYFSGKDELVIEVFKSLHQDALELFGEIQRVGYDLESVLVLAKSMLPVSGPAESFWRARIALTHYAMKLPELNALVLQSLQNAEAEMLKFLQHLESSGVLRPSGRLELMAHQLVHYFQGMGLAMLHIPPEHREAYAQPFFDAFFEHCNRTNAA